MSVGRLIKRKGFNYLLKAFKEVINELPEARLTIIGDGPEYEFLMDYISENSLSKHVSIFKNVSNANGKRDIVRSTMPRTFEHPVPF